MRQHQKPRSIRARFLCDGGHSFDLVYWHFILSLFRTKGDRGYAVKAVDRCS